VHAYGRTHDVANLFISHGSQFTIGAAENPRLTFVALAIRHAEHIAQRMTAKAL
jgi:choline dehydrogenase-like flavoprotein